MNVLSVSSGKALVIRQAEHRERIKKIKTRAAGTSVTLDNRPPEEVSSVKHNPRKISLILQRSHDTEQQNK